jgi:flagellar motility protein MotE (MotC chaperone)
MIAQRRQSQNHAGRISGLGHLAALGLLLGALAVVSGALRPAAAQQDWTPTVATTPGGSFNAQIPGALNREPTRIDPRYFPPRNAAPPVRNPLPQGAWSPIVTGALPQSEGRAPQPTVAPRAGTDAMVPPLDGLSPVRPNNQAATAGGAKLAAEKAGAGALEAASPARTDGEAVDEQIFRKPGPLDALPPNASGAQQYCFNTADTAADARFAWQAKKIQEMEAALDKKAQQLEVKTQEYKRWLERRDDFSRKAHEKLVGFYSRMRADAAAVQLATLDEEMAAAVVMKLETKVASQIMGEMDPERAAKIATIISGAGKIPRDKRRAAGPADSTYPPGDAAASPSAAPAPGGT